MGGRETLRLLGPACGKGNTANAFCQDGLRYFLVPDEYEWPEDTEPEDIVGVHGPETEEAIKNYAK